MNTDERKAWRARMMEERSALRAELEEEYSVKGHEKALLLFDLAWEYGHSSGVEEVRCHYGNLVDLLHGRSA